jgi:hypothetical protein
MRLFIYRKKFVVCGTLQVVGLDLPCDLLSNPILTENTLVKLGSNTFQAAPSFGRNAPEI